MNLRRILFSKLAILAGTVCAGAFSAVAATPTAFDLMKEGNRYVGEQAKDKVVAVRSEKSVGGTEPTVWIVTYYDPTARFKAVDVKFMAGKMTDVKRPMKLIERMADDHHALDRDKLKIDSDKAIATALAEPILEKVSVKAVEAKLEKWDADIPVWRIKIWAEKQQKPSEHANLGEIILSAEEGKVLKIDIHLKRVD